MSSAKVNILFCMSFGEGLCDCWPHVVHGDSRNGNMIVGEEGLRAALDWELTHIGDPMEDLGWTCQRMWRFRNDELEVGGLASRAELREGYEAAGGNWSEASLPWLKTLATLRRRLGPPRPGAAVSRGPAPQARPPPPNGSAAHRVRLSPAAAS